jgi:hypothetical protein
MKIGLNEDGSIFLDGEHNTVVYGNIDVKDGANCHLNNMIICGGEIPMRYTRILHPKSFGSDIKIKDKNYRYIGVQDETEVYWDETEKRLAFGKTPKEIQELFELHKDIDPFGEEDW